MRTFEKARHALRGILSIFEVSLPEHEIRRAVAVAAAFNLTGMPIEIIIVRHTPTLPLWPEWLSIAVSVLLLTPLLLGKLKGKPRLVKSLFVVNALFISLALFTAYAGFKEHSDGLPFQASKLGAIVAGMLAPGFLVGLITIGLHIGISVLQFLSFPPGIRAAVRTDEPWALLAFGLAGCLILAHRLRDRRQDLEIHRALAEAESTRRLAQAFLEIRDLMNTPVQSIELAASLLSKSEPRRQEIVQRLKQSCDRFREINRLLRQYEHKLEWKPERGGLGE